MCCALFRTTKLPVLNYLLLMFSYDMDSVIWLWPAPFLRKLYIARKLCLVVHLQRIWPEEPSTALWWCINEYLTSADTQSPITPGALAFGPSSRERARVPTMDGGSPNSNHVRQKRWWFPRRYCGFGASTSSVVAEAPMRRTSERKLRCSSMEAIGCPRN